MQREIISCASDTRLMASFLGQPG